MYILELNTYISIKKLLKSDTDVNYKELVIFWEWSTRALSAFCTCNIAGSVTKTDAVQTVELRFVRIMDRAPLASIIYIYAYT